MSEKHRAAGLGFAPYHPGQQRSIVFLHGAGVTGWMWDAQVAALTDYHCIAVDLLGHGLSHRIRWESLDVAADLVADIIRATAHGDRSAIVGLSLGGDVGLRLLARHPELIEAAVLTGVVAQPVHWAVRWLQHAAAPLVGWRIFQGATATAMGLKGHRRAAFLRGVPPMRTDDYRAIIDEIFSGVSLAGLEAVQTPTLVLAGSKELAVARASTAIVASAMPGAAARIVPGVGHIWNVEAPELFTRTVRAWIERTR